MFTGRWCDGGRAGERVAGGSRRWTSGYRHTGVFVWVFGGRRRGSSERNLPKILRGCLLQPPNVKEGKGSIIRITRSHVACRDARNFQRHLSFWGFFGETLCRSGPHKGVIVRPAVFVISIFEATFFVGRKRTNRGGLFGTWEIRPYFSPSVFFFNWGGFTIRRRVDTQVGYRLSGSPDGEQLRNSLRCVTHRPTGRPRRWLCETRRRLGGESESIRRLVAWRQAPRACDCTPDGSSGRPQRT